MVREELDSLHISLLGSFQAMLGGQPLERFRTSKVQALFIYLLVHAVEDPDGRVRREEVMALLWPEMPAKSARENLRQTLYQLRKAIPEVSGPEGDTVPFILGDRHNLWLNSDARYQLDVARFLALLEEGEPEAVAEAAGLFQGDFLADFYLEDSAEFEAWAAGWRSQLRRQLLDALGRLVAQKLERGEPEAAERYARRQLEIDDLRESAYRQLMLALRERGKRTESLRVYEQCRKRLKEELGVAPTQETQVVATAVREGRRVGWPPAGPGLRSAPGERRVRLPAPATPLIGREMALEEVSALLKSDTRLVSIVGPGGIGKTRLALEVAQQIAGDYRHGAAFVDLSPLSDPAAIFTAIATALDFRFVGEGTLQAQVLNYLANKELLLVLDNAEHLLEGVNVVNELLQAGVGIHLLVTSRERLKLRAEHVYPLAGLAYARGTTPVEAAREPAAHLFLHHARRVRPAFRLRREYLEPLGEIVRLTEAMPLALILAAGWITIMSPAEIAGELGRSLDFLQATHRDVPPRQRSMRAVFDSTWQRMSAREQALFAALSVFRGGFTLEAARAVTGAAPQELLRLVDRSLLARAESGRFAVHELLRQFAAERLEQGSEGEAIRDAHSAYYLQLLAERLPDLKGRDQLGALRAIERDFENVRAAWGRAIGQEQWQSLPKAGESLCLFALFRSRHRDSIELFEAVRRALPSPASEDERLAYAYATAGRSVQLSWLGVPSVALAAIPELEAVIEGLTDPAALAYCRLMRAGTQYDVNFGDETAAMGAAEAARAYYRQTQEPFYWAFALYVAGFAHWVALRREKGRRLLHHGLALAREAGDRFIAGNLLGTLGGLTWSMDGPTEEAESHFQQAAQLFLELGTPALYARDLIARARVLMWREGDLAESRPLLEEALAVATEQNVSYIHASALAALCTHHWLAGEHEAVLLRTEEMLAMELKKRWVWSWCWATLLRGVVFLAAGDIDGAIPLIRQALSRLEEAASLRWIVSTLPYGGALLARLGKHERGVELLALGLTSFHRGLLELDPLLTRTRSELEEILGEGRFAAAWERGRHLEVRAAATEALAELESLT